MKLACDSHNASSLKVYLKLDMRADVALSFVDFNPWKRLLYICVTDFQWSNKQFSQFYVIINNLKL